jgi:hypothetical protein
VSQPVNENAASAIMPRFRNLHLNWSCGRGGRDQVKEPSRVWHAERVLHIMTKSARTQGRHAITSQIAPFPKNRKAKPPLKLSDWLARDLEPSDLLLGDWLTTTSRCLLPAQSGIGTNFMLALGMRSAAGQGFLHWRGQRAAKVLYIDGEMSRRLLKQRLADEIQRIGCTPAEFHVLSREDVEDFKPLNTPEGAQDMLALIEEIGGVDLAIFDSIMCLLIGSMSEEEPWAQTMQLVRELTRRKVGQIWVHHTGLDKSRGFGTNTREWQLDSVLHLEAVEQPGTDISFRLHFQKARERTPATRRDFQDVEVSLIDDVWRYQLGQPGSKPGRITPTAKKYFDALTNTLGSENVVRASNGQRAVDTKHWQRECERLGFLDPKAPDNRKRASFYKYRRELVTAGRIACEDDLTWLVTLNVRRHGKVSPALPHPNCYRIS